MVAMWIKKFPMLVFMNCLWYILFQINHSYSQYNMYTLYSVCVRWWKEVLINHCYGGTCCRWWEHSMFTKRWSSMYSHFTQVTIHSSLFALLLCSVTMTMMSGTFVIMVMAAPTLDSHHHTDTATALETNWHCLSDVDTCWHDNHCCFHGQAASALGVEAVVRYFTRFVVVTFYMTDAELKASFTNINWFHH